MNKPSLCPFQVGRALLRENLSLCTPQDVKVFEGALRARDIKTLSSYSSELKFNSSVHCLFHDQIKSLFNKNGEFSSRSNDLVAWDTFLKNEKRCRITSKRLDYYLFVSPHRLHRDIADPLYKAQSLIARWLGSFNKFLEQFPEDVRTTGGATCNKPRADTSAVEKIRPRIRITPGGVPLIESLSKFYGHKVSYVVCNYNRITFVPKNYKTSRTIACESDGVLPLQLACDAFLKRRLRRVGINLSDQTRNQSLAKFASIWNTHVTLDLANASDSLTIPVLEFLLPKAFFEFFMRLRASHYKSEYGCGLYSKFASMGNGLTFPLETLVFSAIVAAVGGNLKEDSSVYGDDIIVPSRLFEQTTLCLEFIGFKLNADKTFSSGPFRESCGANWYRGIDVTPFYWRNRCVSRTDISLTINSLVQRFYSPSLGVLFSGIIKEKRIPIIPYLDDLRAGVMVCTTTAYKLKKIRYGSKKDPNDGLSYIRRLVTTSDERKARRITGSDNLRGYLYWLFTRMASKGDNRASLSTLDWDCVEGFVTPRTQDDTINLRSYLHQSVWHPANSLTSRQDFWLDEYLSGVSPAG